MTPSTNSPSALRHFSESASAKDLRAWLHLVEFGHACHVFQTVTNDNKEIE